MFPGFKVVQFLLLAQCLISRVISQCNVADSQPAECEESPVKSVYYTMRLSPSANRTYSASSVINVTIGTTTCPSSLDLPGPKWYKLEATSELLSNKSAGTFNEPMSRSEAHLCEGSIIFSSCEPFVMDLPRTYTWKAPEVNMEKICFKLTVLKSGSNYCEEVTKCISSNFMVSSGTGSGTHETETPLVEENEDYQEDEQEAKLVHGSNQRSPRHEICYTKWNCTNKKQKDFCVSDGHTYPSRCAYRLEKCLTGNADLHIVSSGPCPEPTEPPVVPYCKNDKPAVINFSSWVPKCNCDGTYKAVQCDQNRCWCSNFRGYETINLGPWSCDDSYEKFKANLPECFPGSR